MKNTSKVFVVGNGFDLSLGMKTRYSDFASYEMFWPFHTGYGGLGEHLNKAKEVERWLDIEAELFNYAKSLSNSHRADLDEHQFNELKYKLRNYLQIVQTRTKIDEESTAAIVFKAIVENGLFDQIYTFNYTSLQSIAHKLSLGKVCFQYVHGSLENDDLILGINDKDDLKCKYHFLYKTFDKYYSSVPLKFALARANEVVIYGHSLGHIDYHYFGEFFKNQSREDLKEEEGKKITIFTYNNDSRMDILRQLRAMNGGSLSNLFSNNDLRIICTDGHDFKHNDYIEEYINYLKEHSLKKV